MGRGGLGRQLRYQTELSGRRPAANRRTQMSYPLGSQLAGRDRISADAEAQANPELYRTEPLQAHPNLQDGAELAAVEI